MANVGGSKGLMSRIRIAFGLSAADPGMFGSPQHITRGDRSLPLARRGVPLVERARNLSPPSQRHHRCEVVSGRKSSPRFSGRRRLISAERQFGQVPAATSHIGQHAVSQTMQLSFVSRPQCWQSPTDRLLDDIKLEFGRFIEKLNTDPQGKRVELENSTSRIPAKIKT